VSEPILENAETAGTTCAIGPGAAFDGILSFWGLARVEGKLRGEVVADGTLEVGPEADVHARIEVDVLSSRSRRRRGLARERWMGATGRITAGVRTPRLALAEGGRIEGRLEMGAKEPRRPPPRFGRMSSGFSGLSSP
jgi:cytoskeletal protein CcmA (bactofilin family)